MTNKDDFELNCHFNSENETRLSGVMLFLFVLLTLYI
jgi:hypothetical protein